MIMLRRAMAALGKLNVPFVKGQLSLLLTETEGHDRLTKIEVQIHTSNIGLVALS